MQKIYTAETLFDVTNMKNLLEAAGIHAELRNEFASGGVGELSFINTWPELWIGHEDTYLAKRLIAGIKQVNIDSEWECGCGEVNGEAFGSCWACQADKPK